jgi:hypothetical protein
MVPEDSQADYLARILGSAAEGDLDWKLAEALERWGNVSPIVYDGGRWLAEGVISYFSCIHQIVRALDESIPPGLPAHCFDPTFIAGFLGISVEELHYPQAALDAHLARIESKLDRIAPVEGSGRHLPHAGPAPACGLEVDPDNYRAVLDGQPYPLKSWEQGVLLTVLLGASGNWVSSAEIVQAYPTLRNTRLDRQVRSLPRPIRALVQAKRGTGYRLRRT